LRVAEAELLVLDEVRGAVAVGGVGVLVVDDLRVKDLGRLGWSGSATHIRSVAEALERVSSGEVEYLVVRAPSGAPVAKGGIDYVKVAEAGTLWQLATHPRLQGLGLGTLLIGGAEDRIRARGFRWVSLGVEDHNPRARALYERLGYRACGREQASWEQEDANGRLVTYETEVVVLRKCLAG
jgi:ribosomal protein S18 acetylase RimI-like enzyme